MAIKQYISLEGAEKMISDMKRATDQGEQMLATFRTAGQGLVPLEPFQQSLGGIAQHAGAASSSVKELWESLHILRPALEEVGLSMGNIRELTLLARIGFEGLALALTGAALVGLAKLADQAALTKAKLGDILGSQAAGETAFGKLEQDAAKLGTTAESLVPTFTTLQRVLQDTSSIHFFAAPGQELPSFVNNADKAEKAAVDLFTALRFGRASLDEATKASQAFADALEKSGGKITSAMLVPIRDQFPRAFDAIKTALGGASQTVTAFFASLDKHPKTIEQLDGAFQQLGQQIPKAFDPSKPQSFSDALTIIGNQIKAALNIEQPKAFEESIARLGPAIAQLTAQLVKLSPPVFGALATFFTDLNKGIADSIRQVANFSVIWQAFKKFLEAPAGTGFTELFSNLQTILSEISRTGFAPGTAAVDSFANRWDALNQSIQNVNISIGQVQSKAATLKFVTPPAVGEDPFAKAAAADAAASPATRTVQAFQQARNQIAQIWDDIVSIFNPEQIAKAFDELPTEMSAPFEIAADVITGVFSDIVRAANQMADQIVAAAQRAARALQQLQPGGGGGGFAEIPLAGGGLVRGPGTTTSDSIWARLSNLEYVMRASAVRFYGVDLMHALNAMALPKNFFKGFNLGGLVLPPFPVPAFAQGGLVSGAQQRSLTLVLDGKSFAMSGSRNVVDELERAADLHNLSRIGRAPGWIR